MDPHRHPRAPRFVVALLAAGIAVSATAQGLKIATLQIESTPPGADVELIGGHAGATPLGVSERDIYPNSYPDDRIDMYGVVVLRHPGCEPLRHRVSQTDIADGLHLTLDCTNLAARLPAPSPRSSPMATPTPSTAPPASAAGEDLSQRRLTQLRVLQELLDEGLITAPEEQRVRRAILRADEPGSPAVR